MKVIQKEFGDKEGKIGEVQLFMEKIEEVGMFECVKEMVFKELSCYEKVLLSLVESFVICNYIDWFIVLLWLDEIEDKLDIKKVGEILDKEYYGLEKVKEWILEYLVVKQLMKMLKGLIFCLVGFLGVGKIFFVKLISMSMGCCFVRILLGGVWDEFEICGYWCIYVGVMLGCIIQGMKKVGK